MAEVIKMKVRKNTLVRVIDGQKVPGKYGKVITNGTVGFSTVAEESVVNTTVHKAEAKIAAELLLDGITKRIKAGYIVDLGPLGKLYPAVSSPWKQDGDDLKLSEMTPRVNYKAGSDIAAAIKGATLTWTEEKETEQNSVEDEDNTTTPGTGNNEPGGDIEP